MSFADVDGRLLRVGKHELGASRVDRGDLFPEIGTICFLGVSLACLIGKSYGFAPMRLSN